MLVQLGDKLLQVVSEKQAEAVVNAQKAYDAIKDSDPESVKKWQEAYQKACQAYNGGQTGKKLNYKEYWSRDDGYFDDEHWTHDQAKLDEAYRMLLEEYGETGEINLLNLSPRKMQFIKELVYADADDDTTFTQYPNDQIENILTNHSETMEEGEKRVSQYQNSNKKLTMDNIRVLKQFHDKNSLKDDNHKLDETLDSGWGDVLKGIAILAGYFIIKYGYGEYIPEQESDEGGGAKKGKSSSGKSGRETITSTLGNEIDITPSSNHTSVSKNPGPFGEANSSVDILDADGNIKTRRWYDSDGNAYRDVDMSDHGNPKEHPEVPHEHTWEYDNGKPKRN